MRADASPESRKLAQQHSVCRRIVVVGVERVSTGFVRGKYR